MARAKSQLKMASPAAFAFMGIAATALLAMILVGRSPARRESFRETPLAPSYGALLPGAAVAAEFVWTDSINPVAPRVIGYVQDGEAQLSLVAWDKDDSRFFIADTEPLFAPDSSLDSVAAFAAERFGNDTVLFARGAFREEGAAVALVLQESGLTIARLTDARGSDAAAFFVESEADDLAIADKNGDGVSEIIVKRNGVRNDGAAEADSAVFVYIWNGSRFEYDRDLSWVVTVDGAVFPEPAP